MPRSCSDAFYFHLVYEYLVHMGMDSTSRRMLEECDIYGYPIPYLSEMGVSMEEINRLLQYFDDENCAEFFKDFEIAVPVNIQNTTDCRKLKLGLHVYFAVTGLRYEKEVPSNEGEGASGSFDRHTDRHVAAEDASLAESSGKKNCNPSCPCKNPHCMCRADGGSIEEKACIKSRKYCKEGQPDSSRQLAHPCMATLLAFLEKDGSELSKEPELLPYFALPFILEPEAHPHYEHLFKHPWASNLRRWLWNFLISHRQASRVPELVLLLPDLHSALSGRAGRGISTIMPRTQSSCPSSDHEICMNHVTSNIHGKQRLRQYCPKDAKPIETSPSKKVAKEQEEKPEDELTPEIIDTVKKPVTFHYSKEPPEHEDKEGTAGSQARDARTRSDVEGSERVHEPADCHNQSCLMYGSLRSRYNQLHNDYHDLLGIAAELTDALENCVRGENIDLKKTLENCSLLFPELMKGQEGITESSGRAKKTPLQSPKYDAETRNQDETEPTPRELVIVTDDPPSKTLETETPDTIHTPLKSNVHSNRAHFDRARPTKSTHESNPQQPERLNLFCTSSMIPLYLMQNSDKPKTNISCDLDFNAIKRDLYNGSIKRMILLLQALRWRLTNTSIEQRTSAIESYVACDLLAILPDADRVSRTDLKTVRIAEQTTSLLERLLIPCRAQSPHPLQQASSRLINAIASIRKGRNYLVQSPAVVDVHVRTLYEAELDSISSEMVIATLQKLSLRRSQRLLMIESDLVEWLADQLAVNLYNRGVYWLKYTAALMMNLCLHYEARERCVPLARGTLGSIAEWMRAAMVDVSASSLSPPAAVLLPYLQTNEGKLHTIPLARMVHISPKALPYLNGVMYTLLAHPEINQAAVEMGLARTLQELIVLHEDHEARCQLGHILTLHREQLLADSPTASFSLNQDVEDGKWVLDLLEDELDAADPVQAGPDITGEQLLCQHYSLCCIASSDTMEKTQTFMDMPVINLEECQLPVRAQGSFTTESPQSRSSAKPLVLTPDLPECPSRPSRSSLNLEHPETPPEPIPNSHIDLHNLSSSCPEGTSAQLEPVPSCLSLPIVFTTTLPKHLSKTSTAHSRTSVTLPTFSKTVIPPPTPPTSSIVFPMPRRPRTSNTEPEWTRTAIVLPETSSRNSIVLPSRPRTSFTQSEDPAEWSNTAITMPETSFVRPIHSFILPEIPPAYQTDHIIAPCGSSLAHTRTSNTFPDAVTDVLHESPSASFGIQNAVSEAISTSTGELDLNVGRDNVSSNAMAVSYAKQKHVVRCRTPDNIEVIVAVTLSPDKHGEEEYPEQIVRAYKKIVNVIKSPRKELHRSPSKSQQTEHPNDGDAVIATEITSNSAVPDNPHDHSESRNPKVCGIWSSCDLESDSKGALKSSPLPTDSEITKESIFGSRPRIPRTPPNDSARTSKTNHPQTPPKSKRTRTPSISSK